MAIFGLVRLRKLSLLPFFLSMEVTIYSMEVMMYSSKKMAMSSSVKIAMFYIGADAVRGNIGSKHTYKYCSPHQTTARKEDEENVYTVPRDLK